MWRTWQREWAAALCALRATTTTSYISLLTTAHCPPQLALTHHRYSPLANISVHTYPMQAVSTGGAWPLEFGGAGYPGIKCSSDGTHASSSGAGSAGIVGVSHTGCAPGIRGNFSATWIKLLRDQAPGVPLWPDPEQPIPRCTEAQEAAWRGRRLSASEPLAPGCKLAGDKQYTERMGTFPSRARYLCLPLASLLACWAPSCKVGPGPTQPFPPQPQAIWCRYGGGGATGTGMQGQSHPAW